MEKGSSAYFWIIFSVLTCFNLPFIVVDLVFANRDPACTLAEVQGFSFPLKTWLQVDGFLRVGILGLFMIVAIISCINIECALKFFVCSLIGVVLYSLFNFAWLVVGAVMYWGNLQGQQICSSQINGYMYAVLILGFLGVCGNCYTSYSQKKNE